MNYYPPLDNLSPEATYAFSGLAMVLGISGAVLIIREPGERRRIYVPNLGAQELLEP